MALITRSYITTRGKQKSIYSGDFTGLQELVAEEKLPILILDRIQDTGNLGNILRTAECFGFANDCPLRAGKRANQ